MFWRDGEEIRGRWECRARETGRWKIDNKGEQKDDYENWWGSSRRVDGVAGVDKSFEFKKRSQRPKLSITQSISGIYSSWKSMLKRIHTHIRTHTQHTQRQHCVKIHCMETHIIPHTHQHMHTDEYTDHALMHTQTCTWSFITTCLCHDEPSPPSPLPLNSEGMTFETNRNAGCEDCFHRIYCQKAKPRWKPAKMSAVARQGCFAFLHLQRRAWMFVFALSFFSLLFFQEHHSLAEFMLGILRCLHLLCQRPVVLKSLRCLAWNALCTFLPVISLCFDCMCERAWKQEWERCHSWSRLL